MGSEVVILFSFIIIRLSGWKNNSFSQVFQDESLKLTSDAEFVQ